MRPCRFATCCIKDFCPGDVSAQQIRCQRSGIEPAPPQPLGTCVIRRRHAVSSERLCRRSKAWTAGILYSNRDTSIATGILYSNMKLYISVSMPWNCRFQAVDWVRGCDDWYIRIGACEIVTRSTRTTVALFVKYTHTSHPNVKCCILKSKPWTRLSNQRWDEAD